MTDHLPILYAQETLVWVGILIVLPALAVLLLWAFWIFIMYLLRNAPEEPSAPDEKVRNLEAAFKDRGYRVSFGVFGYSLFLFAACLCGVLFGRLLVTSHSGTPAFILPTQPGLLAAFAVLLPFSASLGLASLLTVGQSAQYGTALPHTNVLKALWLVFGGIACGEGAALSAWMYPSLPIWESWAILGAILLTLGIQALLTRDETGMRTLSAARDRSCLVRSIIARELVNQGLAVEGQYRGESPFQYWARIVGASYCPSCSFR
jgi:hypothetical protein